MSRIPKTYRLSQKTIDELEIIKKIETDKAKALNITSPSYTDILERAVETLYTLITDQTAGDDYLTRITTLIHDAVNQGFSLHDTIYNHILYDLEILKEASYTILKAGQFPRDPEIVSEIVQNKKSIYQPAIEKKVDESIK